MNEERRKFLRQLAATCTAGIARNLGLGATVAAGGAAIGTVATTATATAAAAAVAAPAFGTGVRGQVFEVIVRQAIAGAPWRLICKGPMEINKINEADVLAEVNRRLAFKQHNDGKNCLCNDCIALRDKAAHAHWRKYQERMDAIVHSEKAPCACQECLGAIANIRALVMRKAADAES